MWFFNELTIDGKFGLFKDAFDPKTIKLVSNPPADDVPIMAETTKKNEYFKRDS